MKHRNLYTALLLFSILGLSGLVLAQDTDADVGFILSAFDTLDNYTYTSEIHNTQSFIEEDDQTDISTRQTISGTVIENDYYVVRELYAEDVPDQPEDTPPFKLEQFQLNDTLYVRFVGDTSAYMSIFPNLPENWQSVEEFIKNMTPNSPERLTFENLIHLTHPSATVISKNLIESVAELESEEINDVQVRVFEVEVDAFQVFLRLNANAMDQALELLMSGSDFYTESEFTMTYTLWIGADDGQLYQATSEGFTLLPYLTADVQFGPPYDIAVTFDTMFTISNHEDVTPLEEIAEQVGFEPAP